jgi:hypothetical protein
MYALDDPKMARDIVDYWNNGTASHVETALLDAIAHADGNIKARLRLMFPALVDAYDDWKSNNGRRSPNTLNAAELGCHETEEH